MRDGRLRVPQDLSIVTFDQRPDVAAHLGGVQPTMIELPLRAMGRRLAEMARQIVDGQSVQSTSLPCTISEGGSVARVQ
jgi:DNA-binding LacI/PurR family transcriptional regulator